MTTPTPPPDATPPPPPTGPAKSNNTAFYVIGGAIGLVLVLVAAVVFTLTRDESAATPATTTTTTTTTTASRPTSTGRTATVAQVASIVAESWNDVPDLLEDAKDCRLLSYPECGFAARISYGTLGIKMQLIDMNLVGVQSPTSRTYQGAIPDEIHALYTRTLDVARTAKAVIDDFQAACTTGSPTAPLPAGCNERNNTLHFALGRVGDTLNAWKPYL